MADAAFKLGTFRHGATAPSVIVLPHAGSELFFDIAVLWRIFASHSRAKSYRLGPTFDLQSLLGDWDAAFAALQALADFVGEEGVNSDRLKDASLQRLALRPLPPVPRPGKMLYAAANYSDHIKEMRAAKFTGGAIDLKKDFQGEKAKSRPYLFLKASSCLAGAEDDIWMPPEWPQIDWEAEMALAIGRPGKRITAEKAIEHIAGFMTTNDVSCRDLQWREDRQALRSDWLGGKNHDTFAPMGPYLVPRQFVPDHNNLFIRLWVNGELKQDGNTSDIIFNAEEQIEYVSRMMTLQPGDIFSTGTTGGVGQGSNTFLKVGDIVETEIEGLGRQRNRMVVAPA